jgi:subtilase family serine protease
LIGWLRGSVPPRSTIAATSLTRLFRLTLVSLVFALATAATALAAPPPGPGHSGLHHKKVCGPVGLGEAHCDSAVVTDAGGQPQVTSTPAGYGPSDLRSAYNLAATALIGGSGQTIAIVDAYDDPSAESDLAVYRSYYGLPACTTANGCFRKTNQTGGASMPRKDSGWAQEISLDLDMASAICPNCKILLVEASSNSFANLGAAEDYAAAHANVVSNSFGGNEFSSETTSLYDGHFTHPGVAITASSGDSGYGVEFPAASQHVSAVGGTTLTRASSLRGWTETAWSGAGSGCSAYVAKSSWQTDSGCARRTVADVSAVANPNTGVAVYDSFRSGGWLVFGGTSVAAPVIAGVYALAGNAATVTYGSYPYAHSSFLYDVVSGSNGSCGGSYLCTAGTGFDGPTGLGTPNGTGGF